MGGSSKETTTTSTNSEPWAAAQPYMKSNLQLASNMQKAGVGSGVYQGPTVTPWSKQTQSGMGDMMSLANNNSGGAGLSGQAQSIINNGGYNADQQRSMSYLNQVGDNPFDLSGNETYQRYKQRELDNVADMTNLAASSMGRYGSGAHTGTLVDRLSGASDSMDMGQFARMDDLNSQRFNAAQQGQNNLSNAYQLGQLPGQTKMQIGSMYEDLNTRTNQANLNRFTETNNRPLENLMQYNAIYSGAGAAGGTGTQTATAPGQNPFLTGLGAASTGLGALGSARSLGLF